MVQMGKNSWTISVLGTNGWSILDNSPNKCPRPIETMSKWTCPWTPNKIYNYFLIISLDLISKILKFLLSKSRNFIFPSKPRNCVFPPKQEIAFTPKPKIAFSRQNREITLSHRNQKIVFSRQNREIAFSSQNREITFFR